MVIVVVVVGEFHSGGRGELIWDTTQRRAMRCDAMRTTLNYVLTRVSVCMYVLCVVRVLVPRLCRVESRAESAIRPLTGAVVGQT